ncbi:C1 family peptidase [Gorillibacterium massiliense]|uniref:C1 family peptidase n=1 Tax=Gorillibacterium massiliense TaxID=1280390 RepID=UPI0004BCAE97|nr:C1 family peptidase [Gorillibacterium massiliense]
MSNIVYSLKKDADDSRDYIFNHATHIAIPPIVDLRPHFQPIVDQGQLGSCTANAIVSGLREYYMHQMGNDTQLSRLYFYYKEREREGTINEDSGASLRDGMKVITSVGCALEKDFPYIIKNFTKKPSPQADADAPKYRLSTYHRVTNLSSLKSALAVDKPVVLGIAVYESFESQSVANTGIVPMPGAGEKYLGGHAVLAVGYDDTKRVVIVRNSWGAGWGDKGYFFLPYAMFSTRQYISDMWIAQ